MTRAGSDKERREGACAACAAHFELLHPGHSSSVGGASAVHANAADTGAQPGGGTDTSVSAVPTHFVSPNHWHRASVLYRRSSTMTKAGVLHGRKRKRKRYGESSTAHDRDNNYEDEDDENDDDDSSEDEEDDDDE